MSALASPAFAVRSNHRFSVLLLLSMIVHAILIFGVTFSADSGGKSSSHSLVVTLALSPTPDAPERADFLAQAHQQGGGNSDEAERPTVPPPSLAAAPDTPSKDEHSNVPNTSSLRPQQEPPRLTTREPLTTLTVAPSGAQPHTAPAAPPSARTHTEASLEIARLEAEISQRAHLYAKRPRQRFITATTHATHDAAYLTAWQQKIERLGDLNYPEEARRRRVTGQLQLTVALYPDGSLAGIELVRSSGSKVLDDAAQRIVRLAAPFGPFTKEMMRETDILSITRTWQFLDHGLKVK